MLSHTRQYHRRGYPGTSMDRLSRCTRQCHRRLSTSTTIKVLLCILKQTHNKQFSTTPRLITANQCFGPQQSTVEHLAKYSKAKITAKLGASPSSSCNYSKFRKLTLLNQIWWETATSMTRTVKGIWDIRNLQPFSSFESYQSRWSGLVWWWRWWWWWTLNSQRRDLEHLDDWSLSIKYLMARDDDADNDDDDGVDDVNQLITWRS